ncbi:hypothetical protein MHK_010302 [Candidatus Magnetomorum sp. HK-1]|nr:hypothetical protein MHK_010302 [Candidatus Magnetomorum sp. HK-1]
MIGKNYPKEKVLYILEKPFEEWLAVFDKISEQYKRQWSHKFPSVKGFRDKHPSSYEPRFKQLVSIAKKKPYDEKLQGLILKELSVGWIISNDKFYKILENYKNDEDFRKEGQMVPPNSFLDIGCFYYLRKAEKENEVDLEDIKLYYEFGYFLKDPMIDMIIYDDAKPDFENQKIPGQFMFDFIKHYFTNAAIYADIKDIQKDVELTIDDFAEFMTDSLKEVKETLKNGLNQRKINDDFEIKIAPVNEKIQSIEQMMEKLKASFKTKQLVVKTAIPEKTAKSEKPEKTAKTDRIYTSIIHLTQIQIPEKLEITDSLDKLHLHMMKNLKAIGLIKIKARQLANEILAGLGAGSLIMFSGSLSRFLAETCAKSIAAKNEIQVLHIPVGLLDGYQFHQELSHCLDLALHSDYLTAIIFEGINLSAFECYGQTLRQIITNRLITNNDSYNHIACFATLAEGLAGLPLTKEFCELGPIFDTDLLGWGAKGISGKAHGGTISKTNWNHWINSCPKSEIPESLQTLFEEMSDVSQLWKISIRKTSQFLQKENPLESMGFAWLMQRAFCDEKNQNVLFQFCEENICDNKIDDRVVKMIKNLKV